MTPSASITARYPKFVRAYCTYFDARYLTRGLALWESLTNHLRDFTLYVLCFDDAAHGALTELALPNLVPISLPELERADVELATVRPSRTRIEYYFTATPALPLHVLRLDPRAESVTYLDADLFFFDTIEPLFGELGTRSVGIIAHRFPPSLRGRLAYGTFNVGCVIFRNDWHGLAVLESWRRQCLDWCYDRLEGSRYADQKYLDAWPRREGVAVLEHKGANLAPWNVGGYALTEQGGDIFVDGEPLLFYHFHRCRRWSRSLWQLGLANYGVRASDVLRDRVYRPYIHTIERWTGKLRQRGFESMAGTVRTTEPKKITDLLHAPLYLLTGELVIDRGERG